MSSASRLILLIDDDAGVRQALESVLEALQYKVLGVSDGEQGLKIARETKPSAVLLDFNMPGIDGLQTCLKLRHMSPALPIIILTVRTDVDAIEACLEAGADDYIVKPYDIRELLSRLRAVMRRSVPERVISAQSSKTSSESDSGRHILQVSGLTLNVERRQLTKGNQPIRLTPKEFDLLHHLMSNPGIPLPHARLLKSIWGPEHVGEVEYLRTFICQLRKKLDDSNGGPSYLLTEPYIGYRFRESE